MKAAANMRVKPTGIPLALHSRCLRTALTDEAWMFDFSKISANDWIALYGAVLSSVIALIACCRFAARKLRTRRERKKFRTDLYFLRKVDRATRKIHPIIVVLLANLGTERVSLKSLEYEGITENGMKTQGEMGWYEQPEELYGIRNRLLPCVIESGQTADLPMVEIGIVTRIRDLKIWLTDFDDRRNYVDERDIEKVRRESEKYLETNKSKDG